MYTDYVKRLFDFVIALIGLFFVAPIILVVTVLLFLANKGKPFFIQQRPGKKGEPFYIIKFKTMNDKCTVDGELLSDSDRLTAVGSFVRKTSIDELPQLFNVLKGDMSLVGPRPLLMEYLPLYSREQARRHDVRPGITGWAQVNGRNAIGWDEKFKLDVEYVDNCSVALDMKILWMTVMKVVKSEGVSQEGHVTMEKFKGNKS